ncbi:MAG: hypothetical protein NTV86_06960 [Planctomycetota bacterium]|nr:hypothetical protein [Planctomycetota bacterium]
MTMKRAILWAVLASCGLLVHRATGQTLPPPDEEFTRQLAADTPASMPATGTGSIIVRASQGTKDGPKVGGESVGVDFVCRHGAVEKHIDGVLDEGGLAVFRGQIPEKESFQPIVSVVHAGIRYEARGEWVQADSPDSIIRINLYETTAAEPPWSIMSRQVVVFPAPGGLGFLERLVVHNPTDRTWTGVQVNPNTIATVVLPLPPGARSPELLDMGPDPVPANAANGHVFLANPLTPPVARINLRYIVPLVDGKAKVDLKAPVDTSSSVLMVKEGITVDGETLTFTLTATGLADEAQGVGAGKWLTIGGLGLLAVLVVVGILVKVYRRRRPIQREDAGARSS